MLYSLFQATTECHSFFFSQLFKSLLKSQLGAVMSRPDTIFNIAGRCYGTLLAGRLASQAPLSQSEHALISHGFS
jgi:hypothetical protein